MASNTERQTATTDAREATTGPAATDEVARDFHVEFWFRGDEAQRKEAVRALRQWVSDHTVIRLMRRQDGREYEATEEYRGTTFRKCRVIAKGTPTERSVAYSEMNDYLEENAEHHNMDGHPVRRA